MDKKAVRRELQIASATAKKVGLEGLAKRLRAGAIFGPKKLRSALLHEPGPAFLKGKHIMPKKWVERAAHLISHEPVLATIMAAPTGPPGPASYLGLRELSGRAVGLRGMGKPLLKAGEAPAPKKKPEGPILRTKLQPHQARVLRKLQKSKGVIVAHQLGGGKTLTSIAAAQRLGMPAEVITPASLASNYEKEIAKHVEGPLPRRVRSYAKATRDAKGGEPIDTSGLLILDEAHKLRNTGTASHKYIATPARKAQARLLLTGTPIYNKASDLATLANIAAGERVLPEDPTEFKRTFVKEHRVDPNFLMRMVGVKPGVRYSIANRKKLYNALAGHIDLYEGATKDFPGISSEEVNVPMSKKQHQTYNWLLGSVPWHVRLKIRAGLPPSKQEAKNLNTFLSGVRQASLSPRPYHKKMTDEEEQLHTPKLQQAAERLAERHKANPNFRGVAYSNYLEAGLHPYSRALTARGVPHHVFTGRASKKEKTQMVQDYNSGKVPVLLVSGAGSEGLDLKGTRLIQLMEPHFNNSRLRQVIGRGRRYKSHAHLPEEQRHVHVEKYYSTLPQGRIARALRRKAPGAAEQYLAQRSQEKDDLEAQFRKVMRKAHEAE